ncbi:MAG: COQ9 family protein [Alphaproteobacteria bacterium]|nr:COQ9 family protein [Alphaproteobacteria bacterium]
MDEDIRQKREALIVAALEDATFDGWQWESVLASAARVGIAGDMARALFPGGLADVLDGLADWADQSMLDALREVDPATLKIRERVRLGVVTRLEILAPHKEAMRDVYSFWALPQHAPRAGRILWRTADRIWNWAGDTATDYNHYTKRGLLSGILASTTLVWLNDSDPAMPRTLDFLDRRIENVMTVGKFLGRIIPGKKAS